MPVVQNATVSALGDPIKLYRIDANEGYVLYDTEDSEEERTYHYTFLVPLSFDFTRLVAVLISSLPGDAEIYGNHDKTETM